jgi:TetR/AcrR family transcriptional regulator, cholesterol catabolism regulator
MGSGLRSRLRRQEAVVQTRRRAVPGTEKTVESAREGRGHGEKSKRVRLNQQIIMDAAAETFAQKGFGATSLNDIAATLGVTKVALYYHVKNKEEILRLICLSVLDMAEEPLQRIVASDLDAVEKLQRAIEHHVSITANSSPAIHVFYNEQAHLSGEFAHEIVQREKAYEQTFARIIQEGMSNGVFKPDFDAQIITFGLLGMCHWLSHWYKPAGRYSHQMIAQMFLAMIEDGLRV